MAIASGGTLGTGFHSTSASSFTFNTATNSLASGDVGLLVVVTDNTSTADGDNNEHTSVSGGTGTWTKLGEYTNANGAAAAGVTVSLWRLAASGTVSVGTTITINFSSARVDKTCSFWKFTVAAGKALTLTTGTTNPITSQVDAANGFGSSVFSGLSSLSRLYFRGLGKEANSITQITVSTSFTAITLQRSRNNASAVLVRGEFRINTSTGETSNPTLAVTGDTAGLFAALEETTGPTAGLIAWAELEAPFLVTRGRLSWAELETPLTPTQGRISVGEFEVPTTPTRGLLSWSEMEVPTAPADPTTGRLSWAEFDIPLGGTRGRVAWAEVEAPLSPTRGRFSWAELETPFLVTRGRLSWAELETPITPTRGRFSWAEMETPDPPSPTAGRLTWTEFEVPDQSGGSTVLGLLLSHSHPW